MEWTMHAFFETAEALVGGLRGMGPYNSRWSIRTLIIGAADSPKVFLWIAFNGCRHFTLVSNYMVANQLKIAGPPPL